MRRFLCVWSMCLFWAACGERTFQSSTAPRPAAPAPRAAAAAPQAQPPVRPASAAPQPVRAAAPPPPAAPQQPLQTEAEEPEEVAVELLSDEEILAQRLEDLELEALRQSFTPTELQDPDLPALAAEDGSLLDEIEQDAIPENYDLERDREKILLATQSDLPLTLNDQVARMINYFSGRGAKTYRITMGRAAAYREMIERILDEEGVPAELIHLAQAESGFRPKAVSYARATGMWQFMAFRGKQYGLRQDRYLEERYDFESATRAAARHLKDLYIEFGDWNLAMAAYNSGPGRVKRAIERGGGTRDYWELCRRQLLPRQTRDYVPIIQAMTYIAKHPELYDVGEIDPAPPLRYDVVETEEEISLELIADITGTNVAEIEQLNEALLRSATPPYRYALRLPDGTASAFRNEISMVPSDKRLSWRRHEVDEGESVSGIAKQYGVSTEQLMAVNGLSPDDDALNAGERLTIPAETKLRLFRSYGGAGGLVESGAGRYRVANGDTLGGIARRFGVSVGSLREWNGLSSSLIRAGRYLIVRPDGVGAPSAAAPDGSYRVARGDTLGKIAARYHTSVGQLQAWNGMSSTRIHVGDLLRVPGSGSSESASASSSNSSAPAPGGKYRIRSGDTLGRIASRHGVSVSELQRWNGLRGNTIHAGDWLHVSEPGSAPRAAAPAPVSSAASSGDAEIRYRIRSGDSLATIASSHHVSVSDLKAWNGLRSSRIQAGATLTIRNQPGSGAAPSASSAPEPAAAEPVVARNAPPAPSTSETRYKIRPGDNLGAIAETFGVTASDLREWNHMRGSRITAGDYLVVRPPSSAPRADSPAPVATAAVAEAPKPASGGGLYVVRSGDTLGAIATRHGVTVSDLRAWNGLRSTRLSIGQKLHTAAPRAAGGDYQIRPGDTLAVIARRFNVSVQELMSWNGLTSTEITAGRSLRVRPEAGGDN